MEFNKKLQELRRQKGLTQEELADALYVSRTAVSKWESGRGYPNIASLKQLAKLFSITVDELLSGDQLLTIAEEDNKQKTRYFRDLVFGLLDISSAILFFLPFFAQKANGIISEASLLTLSEISPYLKTVYYTFVIALILCGILTLALQNYKQSLWVFAKSKISLLLNTLLSVLFVISLQPYPAVLLLIFLVIKVLMLMKK